MLVPAAALPDGADADLAALFCVHWPPEDVPELTAVLRDRSNLRRWLPAVLETVGVASDLPVLMLQARGGSRRPAPFSSPPSPLPPDRLVVRGDGVRRVGAPWSTPCSACRRRAGACSTPRAAGAVRWPTTCPAGPA